MGEIGKVQGPEKNVAITEMSLVVSSTVASWYDQKWAHIPDVTAYPLSISESHL